MKRYVRVITSSTGKPASHAFVDVESISDIKAGNPGEGVNLMCGETIYRDFSFYTGDNKQSLADASAELAILRRPEYLIARPPA